MEGMAVMDDDVDASCHDHRRGRAGIAGSSKQAWW